MSRPAPALAALVLFCAFATATQAQSLDTTKRAAVIEQLLSHLRENYVFPDVATAMERALRERLAQKEYDTLSESAFAQKLTADLQAISHDKHLRVRHGTPRNVGPAARQQRHVENGNFAFEKVERLPGNIGYIDLRMFLPAAVAGEKASAVMNELADTDALIFDLRENGGGNAELVALITSYLVGEEPVHLNDFVDGKGNLLSSSWTLREVPGKRYGAKDVYVLTSSKTFSAAEEFSYNLRNLNRATLIGETTGGGANPVSMFQLGHSFSAMISTAQARNPISGTNWERTGVQPHIEVPAEQALETAHKTALAKLQRTAAASK